MKITFISQKGQSFIERNSPHIPVDLAQQCALKAHNHHYTQLEQLKDEWDVVILLIPKTQEDRDKLYSLFPYDSDGNDLIRKAKNISIRLLENNKYTKSNIVIENTLEILDDGTLSTCKCAGLLVEHGYVTVKSARTQIQIMENLGSIAQTIGNGFKNLTDELKELTL